MVSLFFDKRGGEKLLSVWWFFVLVIVGVGIVVAVMIFYSAHEDTRNLEAELLYSKIVNCVVENGFLINGISNPDFDLLKRCNLNEKVFDDEELFYINIGIFDEQGNKLRENILEGNKDFFKECEFQEKDEKGSVIKAKHYSKCFRRSFNVLYEDGDIKKAKLEILTASNNLGRKVQFLGDE